MYLRLQEIRIGYSDLFSLVDFLDTPHNQSWTITQAPYILMHKNGPNS